jgi:hypothetical protein
MVLSEGYYYVALFAKLYIFSSIGWNVTVDYVKLPVTNTLAYWAHL